MSQTSNSPAAVNLSPEEDRFLRGFVRRHSLLGPAGVLAVAALAVGLAALPRGVEVTPADEAVETSPSDALEALRADVADLRRRLEHASSGQASQDAQRQELAALGRRVEAVAEELTGLRHRWETTAAANPGAPPELASMLERLYALETRAASEETSRSRTERDLLDRIDALEQQLAQREAPESIDPSLPAAPAP